MFDTKEMQWYPDDQKEPRVVGRCEHCNEDLEEGQDIYTDADNQKFCSLECVLDYHQITKTTAEIED